jgi:phosphoribosylglycinamide formyltransferase-1
VSNKADAGVLGIAEREGIPSLVISRQMFNDHALITQMNEHKPALIVLAGFLWKMPEAMVKAFPDKIINIHPALLPAYGGKGMYGHHVHSAVITAKEAESGVTIHYVNEAYDDGNIILQARCKVEQSDGPNELAQRIHKLEHFYFPRAIEFLLGH